MRIPTIILLTALAIPLLFGVGGIAWRAPNGETSADLGQRGNAGNLIGRFIPSVELEGQSGNTVSLAEFLAGRPAFLYGVTLEDCLGCGAYADEMRLLARAYPTHAVALIGVGAGADDVLKYSRLRRVTGFVDRSGALLNGLGASGTPLFLVVSDSGRILIADSRPGPQAKAAPASAIMAALRRDFGQR